MFDRIPDVFYYALAGGIGGLARLAMGVTDDNTTIKGELFRIIVISMPIGMAAAQYAADRGMGTMAFAAGYMAGIAALNIARTFAKEGFRGVLETLLNFRGR